MTPATLSVRAEVCLGLGARAMPPARISSGDEGPRGAAWPRAGVRGAAWGGVAQGRVAQSPTRRAA